MWIINEVDYKEFDFEHSLKKMQSGGTKQCFLQHIFLEFFLPLDFQSWQSFYTANFYWIIKGNEFDAVGLYMSFQNGDWTISCTKREGRQYPMDDQF